ncbi:KH domain-containing protein [Tanacetum coccineum]
MLLPPSNPSPPFTTTLPTTLPTVCHLPHRSPPRYPPSPPPSPPFAMVDLIFITGLDSTLSGEAFSVREALYQVATRLHDNPSQTHNLLNSSTPNAYPGAGALMGTIPGAPIMGLSLLVGAYGGYKPEGGDWSHGFYPGQRDEYVHREFSLRNQSRYQSYQFSGLRGADGCIISISSKEVFEYTFSPAFKDALRLQPSFSDWMKGGSIISDMRRINKANIRIISKDDLPKVTEDDDEMVQITGELDLAKDALLQVTSRLRANLFARKGASMSTFVLVLPCLLVAPGVHEVPKYDSRDSKSHGRGHSYSGAYTPPRVLPLSDVYGSYGGALQASVHVRILQNLKKMVKTGQTRTRNGIECAKAGRMLSKGDMDLSNSSDNRYTMAGNKTSNTLLSGHYPKGMLRGLKENTP